MSLKKQLVALRESAVANPEDISEESKAITQKRQLEIEKREASKKKRIEESLLLLQNRAEWVANSTSKDTWFSVVELGDYITVYTLDEAQKCTDLEPVFAKITEDGELIPFVGYRNEKNAGEQFEKIPVLFACWGDEIPPEAPTVSGKVGKTGSN
jgi:hypothetical protein